MRSIRCYRQPDHQHHNRNGYRLGYTSEPASSNRCSRDHNRCGHVRRSEELVLATPGLVNQGRGFGKNLLGVSTSIWSSIW